MDIIYKFIMNRLGNILEKLDYPRETAFKKTAHKITRKVYDNVFEKRHGMSPYSPEAQCDHDLYMEQQEYEARQSVSGEDYDDYGTEENYA